MSRFLSVVLVLVALPAEAGTRPRYGGELRVVSPALPASLDPALLASASDVAAARLLFGSPLTLGPDGALSAELAEVPEPEAGGRLFRLRLRPGRFHDGSAVTAQDLAASLARLLDPGVASPFLAASLPLAGAESGRPTGLQALGEAELQVSLAFPYPDWPRALAHPALAPLPAGRPAARPVGAGAFRLGPQSAAEGLRLLAFPDCAPGRPFVDALRLAPGDARAAARALALGEADAVLASSERRAVEGPLLFATYLVFNPQRLGERAGPLRQAVEAAVDVPELARLFVRGAVPLAGLLPPSLDAGPAVAAPRPARPPPSPGPPLTLLSDASAEDQRAVADRLQVKLHDAGVTLQIRRVSRAEFRQALALGNYDLALVGVSLLPEPGLALAQVVGLTQGRDAARELLRAVGAVADPTARRALVAEQARRWRGVAPLLPLYVQGFRVAVRPGVAGVAFDGSGAPALGDVWLGEPSAQAR